MPKLAEEVHLRASANLDGLGTPCILSTKRSVMIKIHHVQSAYQTELNFYYQRR